MDDKIRQIPLEKLDGTAGRRTEAMAKSQNISKAFPIFSPLYIFECYNSRTSERAILQPKKGKVTITSPQKD